jgi:major membrane immunogen (membrane-anchored lipoprotein)
MKKLLLTFILCCLLLLAACEQSMILETNLDIPQPIDITLPLNIAIFYEKSLREYVYTENSDDRRNWAITIGPSQIAIFDKVLPSMYRNN